jgi:hypothetical protein
MSSSIYIMVFYLLYEGNHQNMDTVKARFFWQGAGKKKKYCMVKWEGPCTPKEFGGLGFLETRAMNTALLAKWLYRIESGDDNLCIRLLWKKYLGQRSMYQKTFRGSAFFWAGLLKVKEWYKFGGEMLIGDGTNMRFWLDCWRGALLFGSEIP